MQLQLLCTQIEVGFPEEKNLVRVELREFWRHRDYLSLVGGVPTFKGRLIIPLTLRGAALENLHAAHQGVKGMQLRAERMMWWPGITGAIHQLRAQCKVCQEVAPSQARSPPTPIPSPDYPFQLICGDHFSLAGKQYLVLVDRFSGWPVIEYCGDTVGSSTQLIRTLRQYFATYGVPDEISTDGGTVFTSMEMKLFLKKYGIHHRISSGYNPHSNQRAELGVKSMKRLCRSNVSPNGSLDNDRILRGLLAYRNTPDPDTNRSPAEVLFGRTLKEFLPMSSDKLKPCDSWRLLREEREKALAKRATRNSEALEKGTKLLGKLFLGDQVRVQNQHGPYPKCWDSTGLVVEVLNFDQYVVKIHGSGRITTRNRQFLRLIEPYGDPVKQIDEKEFIDRLNMKAKIPDVPVASDKSGPDDVSGEEQQTPGSEVETGGEGETHGPPPNVPQMSQREQHSHEQQRRISGRKSLPPDRLQVRHGGKSYT